MNRSEQERLFNEWMAAHGAIVVKTARAFAGAAADRQDLEQELLIAIWRAVPAFRGGSSVSTFLYRVAHNAALTWRRAETSRETRAQAIAAEVSRHEDASTGEHALPGNEELELERLYGAIQALPPVDRSLVLLSLDGVPYAEMASIHGLTVNHVGVRLTRARSTLASKLEGAEL
jgi:RNA polymerase sigma factor (sigma-70 family)